VGVIVHCKHRYHVNFAIGYFCIQWRSNHSFKKGWAYSSHSIKQTTRGLISARCDYQGLVSLEFMIIYLGGNFLFVRCLYVLIIWYL
jgi:hypothetical protein